MLYILLHKNQTGTRIQLVSRNGVKASKELVRLYNEALQKTPDDKIAGFDITSESTVYAEIVYKNEETEWWELFCYEEADVE